ncbi:kinase-like domain-containing protein [Rhizophagus clarus]|uniref:Kinase-like domain-containing protein n=1 Tax=Rhizophagus clarus TaxID=94130 RepID=A0A8H3LVZ5_9GLOM|nr:kinase-like domain-containing protein [Rhizophagus clarus]
MSKNYYEYKDFSNFQKIGSGGFANVYRANWKKSHIRYAIKSFFKIDNATIKAIVREIRFHREVDYHDNVIRFYGVTTSIKENQRKEYSLIIEYADNGILRSYLKENFKNLNWNDKYNLAFQLVHAVSCLHDEGIIHRDLHSNNVLVHQHTVKLSDFGLSKRIEETSNSQSKIFGLVPYIDPKSFDENIKYLLNKKSNVYSIGVLLWEISSGHPPFQDHIQYNVGLAISILKGLRETSVPETSENYIKIYTDCWNIEPDNRPTINQVINELKAIVIKENIIIKDFHLYDDDKDIIQ